MVAPIAARAVISSAAPPDQRHEVMPTHQHNIGLLGAIPPDLLEKVLMPFLKPHPENPDFDECGLIKLSRLSKACRLIALDGERWEAICEERWEEKVQYNARMSKAKEDAAREESVSMNATNSIIHGSFWYRRYAIEERDAKRKHITPPELQGMIFSMRSWFTNESTTSQGMNIAFPSGLRDTSVSDKIQFLPSGHIAGLPREYAGTTYEMEKSGSYVNIDRKLLQGICPWSTFYPFRTKNWGWELRSNIFVLRSIGGTGKKNKVHVGALWDDYISCLVVETRKKGEKCIRLNNERKYKRREVPDILEIKTFLVW